LDLLATITELSHEFGTPDYVKGGGGNSSAKTAHTLWVKPSGMRLAELTPQTFVAMDRAKLAALHETQVPRDPTAREALVKDTMAAAVKPGQTGRASVEAPLHNVLDRTFVVHTHAVLVNGLSCSRHGATVCARLFPDALWVPYVDPGFTLCMDVRRRVNDYVQRHNVQPAILILENHGIFVAGDTPDEIRSGYGRVLDALRAEYRQAGIPTELRATRPADPNAAQSVPEILRSLLGEEAAFVAGGDAFEVAPGPISPDHIVYAKAYPYAGPLTRENVGEFRKRRGYWPKIFSTSAGVFAVGHTPTKAQLALELARDGALVMQLAAAFGGIQFLTDTARDFVENWEVEAYRQQQMK
jgi:rhamnose utilization protein RhaD (predicted bifunctional aldolase and dehydrogenase)